MQSEFLRYSRQLSLKEFGMDAQQRLKQAKVLVVGAGGLGCPALLYLTSCGTGKIGIADFDIVELHNLPRQILFTEEDLKKNKTEAAVEHLRKRNSSVEFQLHNEMINETSALKIFPNYDIILDCTDNFSARYAINDACVQLDKPFVYGSVFRFEGQLSLFNAKEKSGNPGPDYRSLFPSPPQEGTTPDCAEAGVIGFLPGLIGTLMAAEAIKWIAGIGESLSGKLLSFNSLTMEFDMFLIQQNTSRRNEAAMNAQ